MVAIQGIPEVDHILSLLDAFQSKLVDLPAEKRKALEADLREIRTCAIGLAGSNHGERHSTQIDAFKAVLAENDARYHEFAEFFTDPLVVFDANQRLIHRNKAAEEVSQISNEQAIGRTFAELYPHLVNTELYQSYSRAIETRSPQTNLSHWVSPKDGRDLYYEITIYPILDQVVVISRNVTEREQAVEALRKTSESMHESEERFRIMADGTPVMIWVTNANGEIAFINRAYTEFFGVTLEKVREGSWRVLVHPDDTARYVDVFIDCARERIPFRSQGRVKRYDGQWRWIDSYGQPRFSDSGEFLGMAGSSLDITERIKVETALRKSEEKFARAFQSSPVALAITHLSDGQFMDVNDSFCTLIGYSREEIIGRKTVDLGIYQNDEERDRLLNLLNIQGSLRNYEMTKQNKSGELWTGLLSFEPIEVDGQACLLTSIMDVTERKQAERALEKANNELINERNRILAVMEALPVGLAIYDEKGGVIQANPGFEAVWGSPRPKANSVDDYESYQAWWVETGKRVQPDEWAAARTVKDGETVTGQYIQIQKFDGTKGYVINSGAPVRDTRGQIIGGVVAIMDITEQKQLEIEQEESRVRMEVQRRLMEQREKERQGIARDIHDGPIQTLASTAFNLQFLKEAYPDPTLVVELNQISMNVKNAVRELREVVNDLRPPSIIRFGLTRAIQMHTEDIRERYPEMKIDIDLETVGTRLSDQTCLAIFRIFQEGMNNIIRHAEATRVWVRYEVDQNQFTLQLRDNGKGLTIPKDFTNLTSEGHFGLAGMKERIETVGGVFMVSSEPGQGTTITVQGPLLGKNIKD